MRAWVAEQAIGPRRLAQLDSYLGALDVRLTNEQFTRPAEVSAVPLGVPHEGITGSLDRFQGGAVSRVLHSRRAGGLSRR